jgi:hypothetical protein
MAIISASPNPVFLPIGAAEGYTTITWSTETDATGRVWQSIDDGLSPGTGEDTLVAPPVDEFATGGTTQVPISVGKAYIFKLKNEEGQWLDSIMVEAQTTKLEPMVADALQHLDAMTVPIQRVQGVVVDARPESVRLSFSTVIATVPVVEINRQADFAAGGLEHVTLPWGEPKTQHAFSFAPLLQNTKHFFRITAGGSGQADMKAAVFTGTFTTGTRFVRVTVRELEAVHSGDSGDILTNPEGRAEWHAVFKVFDRNSGVLQFIRDFPEKGWETVANGAVVSFPFGAAGDPIPRASRRLRLQGVVIETDKPDVMLPGSGLNTMGVGNSMPDGTTHMTTATGEYADSFADAVLSDLPGTFSRDVVLDSGPFELQFVMRVRIDTTVRRAAAAEPPFVVRPTNPKLALAQGAGASRMMVQGSRRVLLMAQGADRQLYLCSMETDPDTLRSMPAERVAGRWRRVAGELTGPVIVVPSADRSIDFVGTGADGQVLHAVFDADSAAEEAPRWRELRARIAGTVTAVRAADGGLHVLGLARDGRLQHGVLAARSAGGEARWESRGSGELREPVCAAEAGGQLHVFAAGRAGGVFHCRSRDAAEWEPLGTQSFSAGLAARTAHDGRTIVLFGFDSDRTVHCKIWNGRRWTPSQLVWTKLGTMDELDRPLRGKPAAKKRKRRSASPSKGRRR